jgi:hypothetical protein
LAGFRSQVSGLRFSISGICGWVRIRGIRVIRGKKDWGWGSKPKHWSLTADFTDCADGDEEKAEGLKS